MTTRSQKRHTETGEERYYTLERESALTKCAPDRWEPMPENETAGVRNTNSFFEALYIYVVCIRHPLAFFSSSSPSSSCCCWCCLVIGFRVVCQLQKPQRERERKRPASTSYPFCVCLFSRWEEEKKKVKVEVEIKDLLDSCWGNMKKNNVGWNQKTRPAKIFFFFPGPLQTRCYQLVWSICHEEFFFSPSLFRGLVGLCVVFFFSFFVVNHRWDEEDKKEKNNTREDADRRV